MAAMTREQLADCLRVLALNAGDYRLRFGEIPGQDLLDLVGTTEISDDQARILEGGWRCSSATWRRCGTDGKIAANSTGSASSGSSYTRSKRLSRARDGRLEARFPQETVGCYGQSVAQAFIVVLSLIGESGPDRGPAGRTLPQGLAGGIGDYKGDTHFARIFARLGDEEPLNVALDDRVFAAIYHGEASGGEQRLEMVRDERCHFVAGRRWLGHRSLAILPDQPWILSRVGHRHDSDFGFEKVDRSCVRRGAVLPVGLPHQRDVVGGRSAADQECECEKQAFAHSVYSFLSFPSFWKPRFFCRVGDTANHHNFPTR